MNRTKYPRLYKAIDIIEATPSERLDLRKWLVNPALGIVEPTCNTIACAAGWLCMNPELNELGLKLDITEFGITPMFGDAISYPALASFFGIDTFDAEDIFCPREGIDFERTSEYDPPNPEDLANKTDKELWLYRVRKFLLIEDGEE